MKILDIELMRKDETLLEQTWWPVVFNSVNDLMKRYPNMDTETRDKIFEYENCCRINYTINSENVRSIQFDQDKDWTKFLLKWS